MTHVTPGCDAATDAFTIAAIAAILGVTAAAIDHVPPYNWDDFVRMAVRAVRELARRELRPPPACVRQSTKLGASLFNARNNTK